VEKTKSKRFNPDYLQLFSVVTRKVLIGGVFSKTITTDWIDSVSAGNDMSLSELDQLAQTVVKREYGHIRTGQIRGNTFTEESCMIKKGYGGAYCDYDYDCKSFQCKNGYCRAPCRYTVSGGGFGPSVGYGVC
jgi:hypothetical protein